jgi:hypothetical protein
MEVDQKHVTTIRLHDAKGSDIRLSREGHDYQLRLATVGDGGVSVRDVNNVVNITLGHQDVRKLWEQIIQLEVEEHCKPVGEHQAHEGRSILFNGKQRTFQEAMASLFTRMAQEMCEHSSRR